MTSPYEVTDLGVSRACASAAAVYHDPDAPITYEPVTDVECAAAVATLVECFRQESGTMRAVTGGAMAAAGSLSGDRLQGLSEIVQNADDAGATEIRFVLRTDELVAIHNGRALTLADVHALAFPYVTTKAADAASTGRFGIGLSTLRSLAPTYEIHSGHYHLQLGQSGIAGTASASSTNGAAHETVLRVGLADGTLTPGSLLAWSERWDDSALIFLRSVRRVIFAESHGVREHSLERTALPAASMECWGTHVTIERTLAIAPDGRSWTVHACEAPSPDGLTRAFKKTRSTTPVAVALPTATAGGGGCVHAGLPVAQTHIPFYASAQLDPIASRQDFVDNDWNAALAELVADVWLSAVRQAFDENAVTAWSLVPVAETEAAGGGLLGKLEAAVRYRAIVALPASLELPTADGQAKLSELAVEEVSLQGLLDPAETAELANLAHALPMGVRDTDGCWRTVLNAWRAAGVALPDEITVARALPLLERSERSPVLTVRLIAAALDAGLADNVVGLRCLVLRDGSHVRPSAADELRVLRFEDGGLAAALGICDVLHDAYAHDHEAAAKVQTWLRSRHLLADEAGDLCVLECLSAAGGRGVRLPGVLTDSQLVAIRDAMEPLGRTEWDRLGPGIGRAVLVEGFTYERGRPRKMAVRPCEAYQPKSVDTGVDTFAFAADKAPGMRWVATRYAALLRSAQGVPGSGRKGFYVLWG